MSTGPRLLILLLALALVIPFGLAVEWLRERGRRRADNRRRGFEVKQPTRGESPVPGEKENGHG